jgi:hypothetical protein
MLLLNRRKGQSLEKVEKLCRTATAGNNFPTRDNNSDHTCATRNVAAQIPLHLRMRRMIKRNKASANDAGIWTKASRLASSIACAHRGDCGQGRVNRFESVILRRRCEAAASKGDSPAAAAGAAHPSRLASLAPQDDGSVSNTVILSTCASRSNASGSRSNAASDNAGYEPFPRRYLQMLRNASRRTQTFLKVGPFSPKFLAAQRIAA